MKILIKARRKIKRNWRTRKRERKISGRGSVERGKVGQSKIMQKKIKIYQRRIKRKEEKDEERNES